MSRAEPTPKHPLHALLAHYRTIWGAAWAARHQLAGPKRLADETAFLPAALSLQDTPAHPAPRRAALAICAIFVIALLWATLGHTDIVAVAPGRIVVSQRTKTVQPLERSVVKRIWVQDGDRVQAGQLLVELDATVPRADSASVEEQLALSNADERRAAVLQVALSNGHLPTLTNSRERAPLLAEWSDISARLAKLDAEVSRRQAEITTVQEAIRKLERTLPMVSQREDDIRRLTEQGFMSSHAGQDRLRERVELESDLATQRARLREAYAAREESQKTKAAYLAETRHGLSERQVQAASKRDLLVQELNKTEQRSRLTQLTAPVAGTVQQVAVHTEGGVVTEAQQLMVIVPLDAEVTAEVVVDNKDIGFVRMGQSAVIKLETFPFTRYGTVSAQVKSVVADAVLDEKRGAIFPATLKLAQSTLNVDGKRIALVPGMNVTAEIKTGHRRVIDYLLSPMQRALDESLGER